MVAGAGWLGPGWWWVSCAAHVGAAVVGDAAPGAAVEGEGEEEPAFERFDEVALPDHPGTIGCGHFGEPVSAMGWAWRLSVVRGRKRRFWRGAQEPGHAILAAACAGLAEIGEHAGTALSATAAGKACGDQGCELRIAPAARSLRLASMGVKAAPAHLERLGQRAHRMG